MRILLIGRLHDLNQYPLLSEKYENGGNEIP
jgi:hypothetical protein